MASKKDDNKLTYLQMPLPKGQGSRLFKIAWNGLNRCEDLDTGELSAAMNISTDEMPYLTPCTKPVRIEKTDNTLCNYDVQYPYCYLDTNTEDNSKTPIGIYYANGQLIAAYGARLEPNTSARKTWLDFLTLSESAESIENIITGSVDEFNNAQHNVLQFNTYDTSTDSVTGKFKANLIVIPEGVSVETIYTVDWAIRSTAQRVYSYKSYSSGGFPYCTKGNKKRYDGRVCRFVWWNSDVDKPKYLYYKCTLKTDSSGDYFLWERQYNIEDNDYSGEILTVTGEITTMPTLDYAVVHQSRVFGVGSGKVYVSGYNDYANWNLDTSDEYNESNAWVSTAQSNTKAGIDFTGITSFKNHVIAFKKDFVYEIYNNKNPFRLVDVYSEGTIDNRSIQEINGVLIYVSERNVLIYTGSTPKPIGRSLDIDRFTYAAAGADYRRYYLYCEDGSGDAHFFVYDTYTGAWTERSLDWCDKEGSDNASRVISFANTPEGLFALRGDGYVYRLDNSDGYVTEAEDPQTGEITYEGVKWSLETELITRHNLTSTANTAYSNINIKHIKKIQLLADVAEHSEFKVYALYDNEKFDPEKSQLIYNSNGRVGRATARVKLRKSAHYGVKLHIEGSGYVKLYEIELYVESGGDLYV